MNPHTPTMRRLKAKPASSRLDLAMDPATVGKAFHRLLAQTRCRALHGWKHGDPCPICHQMVAPLVQPFGRMLVQASRSSARLTYQRFVATGDEKGTLPDLAALRGIADQAVGEVLR